MVSRLGEEWNVSIGSKFLPIKCLLIMDGKRVALQGEPGWWPQEGSGQHQATWLDTTKRMPHKPICSDCDHGHQDCWRNISNLRYANDTTLMAESKELKCFLMRVKEESEQTDLKLNIQKTKITASGPITSWKIKREKSWDRQILFSWAPRSLQMVTAGMELKDTFSSEEKLWQT